MKIAQAIYNTCSTSFFSLFWSHCSYNRF